MSYTVTTGTSNYFHITDKERFDQLISGLVAESVSIETDSNNNNPRYKISAEDTLKWYAPASMSDNFTSYCDAHPEALLYDENDNIIDILEVDKYEQIYDADGNILYNRYENEDDTSEDPWDWDRFIDELIKIIPDNEAFIWTEVSYSGNTSVGGFVDIVTHNGKANFDMPSWIRENIKNLISDKDTAENIFNSLYE